MLVRACLRDGEGGSPTTVMLGESGPAAPGTSHTVWIGAGPRLRFRTATGELPACGHGTIAALAVLGPGEHVLRAGGRTFTGRAWADGDLIAAAFDPGPVTLRAPAAGEAGPVLAALGLTTRAAGTVVASVGRERLLVPVATRAELAALAPDRAALRAACDARGLLGCYVYSAPDADGRAAARMFAPSIGVPEDIANANSTACLAASLRAEVTVDMGDTLGEPATIRATVRDGRVEVGGHCRISAP